MPDQLERVKAALADRYRIERELGRGGMAVVYLAEEQRHDRHLALKVLRPELAATLGPARFLREIKTTASLSHPHILPLFDSGEANGFLFYVTPYIEGESLRDLLTREKQLPIDDALQITRDVADALGFAHSRNVLHRDIKPENVLLEAGHAILADFGIAKAVSDAAGDRLTETGLAIGTPEYMSPEQAAGSPELDGRSDVYSLACVLYEMLAGDPPFMGSVAQAILARKAVEVAPSLRHVRETVPPTVNEAVARALARVPADRFRSVKEFVDALLAPTPAFIASSDATTERGSLSPLSWSSSALARPLEFAPIPQELDVFGLTHPGKVQKVNQDHFILCRVRRHLDINNTSLTDGSSLPLGGEDLAYFAIVADGMGRGSRGAEASRLAIEETIQYFVRSIISYRFADASGEKAFTDELREAVMQCHARVLQRSRESPSGRGMATTLTAWIGVWPQGYLVHVGDSRCYAYVDGELHQVSRDQAVTQDSKDHYRLPESNDLDVRSSAVGGVQVTPVIRKIGQQWGPIGLLCTKGLTQHVSDDQIGERLRAMTSAKQACEDLLQDALNAGGSDNITIVIGRAVATDVE